MDVYGHSTTPDHVFHIDDLLDFSNDQIFSSASSPDDDSLPPAQPPLDVVISSSPPSTVPPQVSSSSSVFPSVSHEFTDDLYLPVTTFLCRFPSESTIVSLDPSDDVAELEWLSRFVDDSYADDIPANSLTTATNVRPDGSSLSRRPKGKRSRPIAVSSKPAMHGGDAAATDGMVRTCTHCGSEKTPQWRTGPMGPKTLCNACGVRYKSGRLVPEYRPAASPTFVLTQHSNSHRKVVELRRQKEVQMQRQQDQMYGQRHHRQQHDFEVC